MIQLHDYQERCIAGLRSAFASGRRSPLLVSPTGSGKTVMFSYLSGKLLEARKSVVVMAHREELCDQISRTLTAFDVPHGMIAPGEKYDRRRLVHVASVQTLARRLSGMPVPDYVICDEAHHAIGESTWGRIITGWNTRTIGVTATPKRLSGEGLGELFDEMVMGPTVRELIDAGRLSDYRLFAPPMQADLSGITRRAGDFARGEAAAAMDKPAVMGDAVKHYRKLCDGAPAVAFCVSIEHAAHTADQFRAQGYRAMSIDGKMDKTLRREIGRDFAAGKINVLTSCDLISEGYDMPGIVAGILLRPTQSLSLYLQQVGRTLRTAPGKDRAIILDHVGNSARHGLPDDEREWSLDATVGKKKDAEQAPPARTCERCFAVSPAYMTKCRDCGHVFTVQARELKQVDGDLAEVDVAAQRAEGARMRAAARTLEELVEVGKKMGYKPQWAKHVFEARKGR